MAVMSWKDARSNQATYKVWIGMRARCQNPVHRQFRDYGGRGIDVCSRWAGSYEAFVADMGPRPQGCTLGRIDNDGPYSPENCRWETPTQQSANRRNTVWIDLPSGRVCLKEACMIHGLRYEVVAKGLKRGRQFGDYLR